MSNLNMKEEEMLVVLFPCPAEVYEIWENRITNLKQLNFFLCSLVKSIEDYANSKYLSFDAHTTSNCCHGMALLARFIFMALKHVELHLIKQWAEQVSSNICNQNIKCHSQFSIREVDWRIIVLVSLYVLTCCGDIDPKKGRRTLPQNLKNIAPIGTMFADILVSDLQKYFSNKVANSYQFYLNEIEDSFNISGASVKAWGKYVQPEYFRKSIRSITYAPCLFSTQIILAYLIKFRIKMAFINDLMDLENNHRGRYLQLFEGNGIDKFKLLNEQEISLFEPYDFHEPVIVFGGCSFSDNPNLDLISLKMLPWLNKITNLILACDVFYPQFPKVTIDPNFDSSPIVPKENFLKSILEDYSQIKGVSAEDPSLFCLTHIFACSLGQVIDFLNNGNASLPCSSIYFPYRLLKINVIKETQICF